MIFHHLILVDDIHATLEEISRKLIVGRGVLTSLFYEDSPPPPPYCPPHPFLKFCNFV